MRGLPQARFKWIVRLLEADRGEGKLEVIGGVACYTATPEGDYAKDKVVLYLSDAIGIPLVNNKASNLQMIQVPCILSFECSSW